MNTVGCDNEKENGTDEFGSERIKNMLLTAKDDEKKMAAALKELEIIVYRYAMSRVKRGFKHGEVGNNSKALSTEMLKDEISQGDKKLGTEDYHEFAGVAVCEISRSISRFIAQMDNYPDANQRRAWLRKVIYNTLAKYLKSRWSEKKKEVETVPLEIEIENDGNGKATKSIERIADNPLNTEYVLENQMYESTVCEMIIKAACSARSKPHHIIAFLINRVIIFEMQRRKYNCDAKKSCLALDGITLFEAKNGIISQFYKAYGIMLDESVIYPLEEKLGKESPTEAGMVKFRYTTDETTLKPNEVMINERYLANMTNQMTKRIRGRTEENESLKGMLEEESGKVRKKGSRDDDSDA